MRHVREINRLALFQFLPILSSALIVTRLLALSARRQRTSIMTASILMYVLWGSAVFSTLCFLRGALKKEHPLAIHSELAAAGSTRTS